jgi:hypothetical protein
VFHACLIRATVHWEAFGCNLLQCIGQSLGTISRVLTLGVRPIP